MKAPAPTVLNKKLILHFDVDQVLRLPSSVDKDLFVMYFSLRFMTYVPHGSGVGYKKTAKKTLRK